MAELISLPRFKTDAGSLTVIEKFLPGSIRRVYFISDVQEGENRRGYRHTTAWQALICVKGSCRISVNNGSKSQGFRLEEPTNCLLIAPQDWHQITNFSTDGCH
jgi:hypothetical protein